MLTGRDGGQAGLKTLHDGTKEASGSTGPVE